MPRRSKGYSEAAIKKKGKWYGRLRLTKLGGKEYVRQARNKTHARQVAKELAEKYVTGGAGALDAAEMTFADLAEFYKAAKVIDPIYDGEIKVAGMQAKESAEKEIKTLLEYWSSTPVQSITHADLDAYKIEMLRRPVIWRWRKGDRIVEKQRSEPRKIASVNHLLRRLRAMLNFARRKGWLMVNPFNQGESLISEAAEIPRNRAEKAEELERILGACTGRRAYLRPIILVMADSALRLTEAKRLTRVDLDFDRKVAYIRARKTKANKLRIVPLSDRLIEELRIWAEMVIDDSTPILQQGSHKTAWKNLKKAAGIADDLQLRDLRGWGTSRIAKALAAADLPWEWGMKATGHTQIKTYQRYIKTDEDIARQTGEAIEKFKKKVA